MHSSTGQYYPQIDHLRALAAFMVFCWHFVNIHGSHEAEPPFFPLSLFAEGHTGVSLFMVLSGYIFSKLTFNKKIIYHRFIWNRLLRLLPLMSFVIVIVGLIRYEKNQDLLSYAHDIMWGVIKPTWPNGGWSITCELHFYIIFPMLLLVSKRNSTPIFFFLCISIFLRVILYSYFGEIQSLSYWTIIGRVDQFLIGMLAYKYRKQILRHPSISFIFGLFFLAFYYNFDLSGGFFMSPSYPSDNPVWIVMPTIEALFYMLVIIFYDCSSKFNHGQLSNFFAKVGACSFSIYLLQAFFVRDLANFINAHITTLANIHVAIFFSIPAFFIVFVISIFSHTFVEKPFLKLRKIYTS